MTLKILAIAPLMLAVSACANEPDTQAAGAENIGETSISAAGPSEVSGVSEVSIEQADALIAGDPSVIVLDVRTPAEFAEGHIDGAINVDFSADDFAEDLAKLDGSARYLLHCKSGGRSSRALAVMQDQGFDNIAHMSGGFDAWTQAGQPVAD